MLLYWLKFGSMEVYWRLLWIPAYNVLRNINNKQQIFQQRQEVEVSLLLFHFKHLPVYATPK